MKMRKPIVVALACITVCFVGLVFYFLQQNKVKDISLNKEADCYLLTLEGVYALKSEDRKLKLLEHSDTKIADYVHYIYPRGELEGRYLLLSEGWEGVVSYPTGIVSIDFMTGNVQSHNSDHYALTGSGQSEHYFYTWQTTAEDSRISQFDIDGNEIQSKVYEESLISSASFINQTDGYIYVEVVQNHPDGSYDNWLVTIDEKDLSIVSKLPFYQVENQHYRFGSTVVPDGKLYAPLNSIRDRTSQEIQLDNRLFITDLSTNEVGTIQLEAPYPFLISQRGNYLFIEHEATNLGYVGFSIVNAGTHETKFINLSHLLEEDLNISSSFIQFFTIDNKGRLLFTLQNKLVYFDIQKGTILDVFEFDREETPIYIWTVK